MILNFEAFPTLGIGNKLELPSIAEIIRSPMYKLGAYEEVYRNGGQFNRWLIDQAPISGEYEHVAISVDLKCLSPKTLPMRTLDWHSDGSQTKCPYFSSEEKFHILIGYTDLTTHFLEEEATMEVDDSIVNLDHYEFRRFVDTNKDKIVGLKSKQIPQDSFVTFNSRHLHRVPDLPTSATFRLSMIIRESNFKQSIDNPVLPRAYAWNLATDESCINNEHIERGIVLRALRPY